MNDTKENLNIPAGDEWELNNLPNRLTLFRIISVPIVIACLSVEMLGIEVLAPYQDDLNWTAGWIFVAASITDFFDGYFARKRNIVTVFGSFLDPIADKFLVVSALILLQEMDRIPTLIVLVLVMREFFITSLRLLAKERNLSVPVSNLGKFKTVTQMVGIPLLMASGTPWGIPMATLGTLFIYLAGFFSIYSAAEYSMGLLKKLKIQRQEKILLKKNKT